MDRPESAVKLRVAAVHVLHRLSKARNKTDGGGYFVGKVVDAVVMPPYKHSNAIRGTSRVLYQFGFCLAWGPLAAEAASGSLVGAGAATLRVATVRKGVDMASFMVRFK
jgi:hypothetical protein